MPLPDPTPVHPERPGPIGDELRARCNNFRPYGGHQLRHLVNNVGLVSQFLSHLGIGRAREVHDFFVFNLGVGDLDAYFVVPTNGCGEEIYLLHLPVPL
eukprot:CAMPEP_0194390910 /NCGR_PEP_ID=MMETSP0174-20130528/112588_1 /TAXON_ID=216777 /ORGANISM="Proboscia alata, Strain PI-D3" /LENGTH=98 /DNA_ID=CAMNT_0039184711 /DNA_START=195 /DNA_END=491 /DNA_ORIENTATION=+